MDSERELLKGNTPTLVLAVLRDGPLHGYAIAREIERRSEAVLQFREGTLYPALHSLERQGWIAGEWELPQGGRPRKVYTLTPAGHTVLEQRTKAWERFAGAVRGVITGGEQDGGANDGKVGDGTGNWIRPGGLAPEPTG
jgi:PadR family transcriptional regulator PadR